MTSGARVEAEYDELEYPSYPLPYCQPSRMGAMARLMGLEPPPVAGARVLELGCASGGNIIPLAARYPGARFLGVDLSRRHVEQGAKQIAQLGMGNIELRQGDLATATFEPKAYDFIICHGVYSWVPESVQKGIFRILAESLSANGIAAISYNVLPGWHFKRITRDICLRYAGDASSPEERAAKARLGFTQLVDGMPVDSPYTAFLQNEVQAFAGWPNSYICAEFLAERNVPFFVREFVEQANACGLDYLSDGDLSSSFVAGPAEARVRRLAEDDGLGLQECTDFFTGRHFRRSLLVRRGRLAAFPTAPELSGLMGLHFAADLRMHPGTGVATGPRFVDRLGQAFTPSDARTGALFAELASAYPSTRSFVQLTGGAEPARVKWAFDALHAALSQGRATVDTMPLSVGRANQQPAVWRIARLQAAAGLDHVASQNHEMVGTDALIRFVLKQMDGTRTVAALCDEVACAVGDGLFPEHVAVQLGASGAIKKQVEAAIGFAARSALLAP